TAAIILISSLVFPMICYSGSNNLNPSCWQLLTWANKVVDIMPESRDERKFASLVNLLERRYQIVPVRHGDPAITAEQFVQLLKYRIFSATADLKVTDGKVIFTQSVDGRPIYVAVIKDTDNPGEKSAHITLNDGARTLQARLVSLGPPHIDEQAAPALVSQPQIARRVVELVRDLQT